MCRGLPREPALDELLLLWVDAAQREPRQARALQVHRLQMVGVWHGLAVLWELRLR